MEYPKTTDKICTFFGRENDHRADLRRGSREDTILARVSLKNVYIDGGGYLYLEVWLPGKHEEITYRIPRT